MHVIFFSDTKNPLTKDAVMEFPYFSTVAKHTFYIGIKNIWSSFNINIQIFHFTRYAEYYFVSLCCTVRLCGCEIQHLQIIITCHGIVSEYLLNFIPWRVFGSVSWWRINHCFISGVGWSNNNLKKTRYTLWFLMT